MQRLLLLGEIMEYIQHSKDAKERKIHTDWSANEKTAMETALGMSYAGKRTMVAMKHVGLNVAADAFVNSSITGANGGIIVVVADDPSMHSSQNEQDSRYYGKFSLMPILEPSTQQEAYDMIHYGFEMSEKFGSFCFLPLLESVINYCLKNNMILSKLLKNLHSTDIMMVKTRAWELS